MMTLWMLPMAYLVAIFVLWKRPAIKLLFLPGAVVVFWLLLSYSFSWPGDHPMRTQVAGLATWVLFMGILDVVIHHIWYWPYRLIKAIRNSMPLRQEPTKVTPEGNLQGDVAALTPRATKKHAPTHYFLVAGGSLLAVGAIFALVMIPGMRDRPTDSSEDSEYFANSPELDKALRDYLKDAHRPPKSEAIKEQERAKAMELFDEIFSRPEGQTGPVQPRTEQAPELGSISRLTPPESEGSNVQGAEDNSNQGAIDWRLSFSSAGVTCRVPSGEGWVNFPPDKFDEVDDPIQPSPSVHRVLRMKKISQTGESLVRIDVRSDPSVGPEFRSNPDLYLWTMETVFDAATQGEFDDEWSLLEVGGLPAVHRLLPEVRGYASVYAYRIPFEDRSVTIDFVFSGSHRESELPVMKEMLESMSFDAEEVAGVQVE